MTSEGVLMMRSSSVVIRKERTGTGHMASFRILRAARAESSE